MDSLGTRIKELLEKKNMSQKELAEKVGCTTAAVSHYIKGDRIEIQNLYQYIDRLHGLLKENGIEIPADSPI